MPPHTDQAKWFTEEILPHERVLRAHLRGAFPAVRDVDDVVQESFLRVWRARAAQPVRQARAFLFRVARNLALDTVRRDRVSPITATADLAELPVAVEALPAAELLSREEKGRLLGEALAALPDRCREIVFLHKIKGLSQRAVAERLGVTEKTVANHVGLGVRRCEDFFRRRGIEFF